MAKNSCALPFRMPRNSCNAHLHIIDPAFDNDGKAAAQIGTLETYRALAQQLRLKRAVFVQAKPFALNNSCLLDAIDRFGIENARGIAVVNSRVSDLELEFLHTHGIRGLRFSLWNPSNAVVGIEDCLPLSERIKHLDWNIQLHMSAAQIAQYSHIIRKLNCRIVFDHMGRLSPQLGTRDPSYSFLQEMIDRGNVWIKLSGPYLNTNSAYPWDDAATTARAIARFAPERVVWGSDFPHITEKEKPAEADLVRMIAAWLPNEKSRRLALEKNPEELYGF